MEEYLSTDIYVSKRNNSLINGKMIGRDVVRKIG